MEVVNADSQAGLEEENVAGPILEIGNTNFGNTNFGNTNFGNTNFGNTGSRYEFSLGARRFVGDWSSQAPPITARLASGTSRPNCTNVAQLLAIETRY